MLTETCPSGRIVYRGPPDEDFGGFRYLLHGDDDSTCRCRYRGLAANRATWAPSLVYRAGEDGRMDYLPDRRAAKAKRSA